MTEQKMKAVVMEAPETVSVREIDRPGPLPGEILIRIEYCLLCTWEQRIFSGASSTSLPFIAGHEASGVVEFVPKETATTFRAGDNVVFKTLDHCGHCTYCYTGFDNQCIGKAKKRFLDDIPGSGGLAQYISLDVSRVFPFPGSATLEEAAFAEPLACCVHSVKRGNLSFGDTVVIIGAGIMGQLHAILARLQGCRVIVIEPDENRRILAEKLGAHVCIDPFASDAEDEVRSMTGGEGADIIFLTANAADMVSAGMNMLRKMGRIVLYGSFNPNKEQVLDPNKVHYSEMVITGSSSPATSDFLQASRLLSFGLVPVKEFIYNIYPLQESQEAMKASLRPDSYRVGIKMHP